MQNRFGFRDFLFLVLVIGLIVSVWLSMVQSDKITGRIAGVQNKLDLLEQRLANLQTTLESGAIAVGVAPGAAGSGAGAGQRDESWAREGAPVQWWPMPAYVTEPRENDDYAVGGVFTEIFEGQPPTITPYRYADVYGRRVVDLVCEKLGRYHPTKLQFEGVLAEAWQYDPNGYWLRVKIRPSARFSDGQPVTAEDVRFSFHDIAFNPEIEADRFRSTLNVIEKVEVISDKVVEFTFKEPRFTNLDAALLMHVLPKHIYSQYTPTQINESTSLLVGSGPFKMENVDIASQWKPGEPIRLVRNEAYWGRKPALAGVTFTVVQDTLARLTAFTNGQGSMMRATPKQYEAMIQDEQFLEKYDAKMWFNIQGGYSFIGWQCGPRNGRLTPFHDKRVRRAMTHLIDRENVILGDIQKNLGRVATSPFASETPQANPAIKPWPYSVERARELLAEAGWLDRDNNGILENENGDEFRFAITFGQGSEGTLQMVTYLKDQCAKVGIICELNPIDWSILADILNKRDFDAITFAWSASIPESDPYQIWHSSQIDGQGDNFIQWNSPEADRLIDQGRVTVDFEERMKVWHRLHEVFHDEQPYTFLTESPWLRFVDRKVGNFQTYKTGFEYQELYIRDVAATAAQLP